MSCGFRGDGCGLLTAPAPGLDWAWNLTFPPAVLELTAELALPLFPPVTSLPLPLPPLLLPRCFAEAV